MSPQRLRRPSANKVIKGDIRAPARPWPTADRPAMVPPRRSSIRLESGARLAPRSGTATRASATRRRASPRRPAGGGLVSSSARANTQIAHVPGAIGLAHLRGVETALGCVALGLGFLALPERLGSRSTGPARLPQYPAKAPARRRAPTAAASAAITGLRRHQRPTRSARVTGRAWIGSSRRNRASSSAIAGPWRSVRRGFSRGT